MMDNSKIASNDKPVRHDQIDPIDTNKASQRHCILTVDFEDYRRQELRDHLGVAQPPNPDEVLHQLDLLLEMFEQNDARATFFSVGRLANELPPKTWQIIASRHRIGCHGFEHDHVRKMGPERFLTDLQKAKRILEDVCEQDVISYRAPYFSNDGCDPWYGECLAQAGFKIDSSKRVSKMPDNTRWTYPLQGSADRVIECPFPCVGIGSKRLTVIGGTYFRLMPINVIQYLLRRVEKSGFIPMIYLHPYDVDPDAAPLAYPQHGHRMSRLGDRMRRTGRATVAAKLEKLADTYSFIPVEDFIVNTQSVSN